MQPLLILNRKYPFSGCHRHMHGVNSSASIHGHNFELEVGISIFQHDPETGMAIGLGEIATALHTSIGQYVENAMLLNVKDPLLRKLIAVNVDDHLTAMKKAVEERGFYTNKYITPNPIDFSQRLFLMRGDPTLENLTALFMNMLVKQLSEDTNYGVKYSMTSFHITENQHNSINGVI